MLQKLGGQALKKRQSPGLLGFDMPTIGTGKIAHRSQIKLMPLSDLGQLPVEGLPQRRQQIVFTQQHRCLLSRRCIHLRQVKKQIDLIAVMEGSRLIEITPDRLRSLDRLSVCLSVCLTRVALQMLGQTLGHAGKTTHLLMTGQPQGQRILRGRVGATLHIDR